MASSHIPDTTSESPITAQTNPNLPLMSVLRQDNSAPGPSLQFESAAGLLDELEDSEDDLPRSGEKRSGRRKIKIEYIEDKSRRHITFSKRKAGIMKKAYELSTLTGTQVLLLVASETGHVYTFATPKLQPLITKQEGKNLIQACLNSPDHHSALPDYIPIAQNPINTSTRYENNEINEEDLTPRPGSTITNSSSAVAQLHGYLPSGTTPTPPSGSSAASVAAAAAQVFMNSGNPAQYVGYAQQASSGNYWNGGNPASGGMYAPIPAKSGQTSQQQLQQLQQSQHSQQQQQQQQQQMYHALIQQQQLFQQYQQHQNQPHHHKSHDNSDA